MYRLHNNSFEILSAEIEICKSNDKLGKQKQQVVLKRLEQLRLKVGKRAKLNELRAVVVDVFPIFSEMVLKEAAKVNRQPSIFHKFKYMAIALASAAGVLTMINLPHPNIRWLVARKAPMLLIPSYLSIDSHYWKAKNSVQQAANLLDSADSFIDIEQVELKTQQAEKYLGGIPVWFLGYYPEAYCENFYCSWNFSFDEFAKIRTQLTQVETITFREKRAFVPLLEAEQAYKSAKQELNIAKTQKQKEMAIASLEAAINAMEKIPPETLASKKSAAKLQVYKRYFQKVAQKK